MARPRSSESRRKSKDSMETAEFRKRLMAVFAWFYTPFAEGSGLLNVLKNWGAFLVVGFLVMAGIQSFKQYDFSQADTLTSETGQGCDMWAMLFLLILPPFEEAIFRIVPYHYMGKKAAFVGSVVWAILHVVGRNWAIVGFQLVMSMFYFKLVTAGRYRESVIFHEAFNLLPLLTCFLF